jgi:hypothetical protein
MSKVLLKDFLQAPNSLDAFEWDGLGICEILHEFKGNGTISVTISYDPRISERHEDLVKSSRRFWKPWTWRNNG